MEAGGDEETGPSYELMNGRPRKWRCLCKVSQPTCAIPYTRSDSFPCRWVKPWRCALVNTSWCISVKVCATGEELIATESFIKQNRGFFSTQSRHWVGQSMNCQVNTLSKKQVSSLLGFIHFYFICALEYLLNVCVTCVPHVCSVHGGLRGWQISWDPELQTVVNCLLDAGDQGPLEEQQTLLTTEPSLTPSSF